MFCLLQLCPILAYFFFLKPFLKGKILRSGEWERGKFDFDHHFGFLTNFLKRYNFLLGGILFGSSRGSFSKKLSKTDLPFKFCKIGLKNTLFIFGRKNGRLLFVVCCCCRLLQLCPILAYFFFNWSTHRAEKDAFKEKIIWFTVWELLNP